MSFFGEIKDEVLDLFGARPRSGAHSVDETMERNSAFEPDPAMQRWMAQDIARQDKLAHDAQEASMSRSSNWFKGLFD